MLAENVSSVSASPKLRLGGPTSPPEGTKPVIWKVLGSCDVFA